MKEGEQRNRGCGNRRGGNRMCVSVNDVRGGWTHGGSRQVIEEGCFERHANSKGEVTGDGRVNR